MYAKKLKFFFLFLTIAGCVEPYEFIIHDNYSTLVVEAFISDRSFNETLLYPSDGRYFTVKLSRSGDVINSRPEPETGALVELISSTGEMLVYVEEEPGKYQLPEMDFKAQKGREYKLRILLADESVYESGWEALPEQEIPTMGNIGFTESEK